MFISYKNRFMNVPTGTISPIIGDRPFPAPVEQINPW
jgi:hypothetical protein